MCLQVSECAQSTPGDSTGTPEELRLSVLARAPAQRMRRSGTVVRVQVPKAAVGGLIGKGGNGNGVCCPTSLKHCHACGARVAALLRLEH